jgi:hypothetical protein
MCKRNHELTQTLKGTNTKTARLYTEARPRSPSARQGPPTGPSRQFSPQRRSPQTQNEYGRGREPRRYGPPNNNPAANNPAPRRYSGTPRPPSRGWQGQNFPNQPRRPFACWRCSKNGHRASECRARFPFCSVCGITGHWMGKTPACAHARATTPSSRISGYSPRPDSQQSQHSSADVRRSEERRDSSLRGAHGPTQESDRWADDESESSFRTARWEEHPS